MDDAEPCAIHPGTPLSVEHGSVALVSAGRRATIVGLAALQAVVVVALSAIPTTVVELNHHGTESVVNELMPQGWAFFTRDPREVAVSPLVRAGEGWTDGFAGPNAQPRFLMGLDRSSRLQELELTPLVEGLLRETWVECRGVHASCVAAAPMVTLANTAASPTLCGEVAFVRGEPIPWAWYRAGVTETSTEVVRAEVNCDASG